MVSINHKELKRLLPVYYQTKTPMFVWGTFGIGKSYTVREVAKQLCSQMALDFVEGEPDGLTSFGFIDVRISQLEPSDLRGLPNISENKDNEQVTKWIIPNWLPRNEDSKGILFFDELNLAPPSIQASAYQLILDRRLGDYKLPDGWLIISAGNTSSDKANVFDLPKPLANRYAHLELRIPTKDEWVEWALKNGLDPSIISFVEFKPSLLYKFDKNMKDNAIPTPRSWEYASKLIKGNISLSLDDKQILVSSAVGDGCGIEFSAFLKLQKKINIKELLNNPKLVEDIKEIDLKYSLLSAVVEEYITDKNQLAKILEICKYLEVEFSILLLRFLKNSRETFVEDILKTKSWKEELSHKYKKYLLDLKED